MTSPHLNRSPLTRFTSLLTALVAACGLVLLAPPAPASAQTVGQAAVEEAARHAGKPYAWGATGPSSFDCSGFTGYVYRSLGVNLPRTSRDQYVATPKVSQSAKAPGDLIFTYNSRGIYHVGIYAGSNRMWAAPKTGDVVRLQTIWTSQYYVTRPVVTSPIVKHWAALGGRYGALGAPVSAESRTPDGTGKYTHYQHSASIFWTAATGARSVRGPVRAHWAALGWERGLGYPTTDQRTTPDGVGRYNHFSKGASVYWTATTGARSVKGAIRSRWASLGWERGLGYPLSNETVAADGVGRYNHFSKGASVYWTPATGAHAVKGPIRAAWSTVGREAGKLGYPTSSEYVTADGLRRNNFVRGHITLDPATGRTEIRTS